MTPHQIVAVAVRLFAILAVLLIARELFWTYIHGREEDTAHMTRILVEGATLGIVPFAALWYFPQYIARGLLPISSGAPVQPWAPDIWLAIGSSLIGLRMTATAIPALTNNLAVLFLFRLESPDKSGLISGLLYSAVQFAVGLALILRANALRNFMSWWMRTAGTNGPADSRAERDAPPEERTPNHKR
ncbi:MAG: hypothetical protein OEV08_06220 [Nitrospira sp.]|nr:hypothetical protein [Nitrospira sp.]